MTLAKGQGSFRRKGKEIASDDPATRDVGEEALSILNQTVLMRRRHDVMLIVSALLS